MDTLKYVTYLGTVPFSLYFRLPFYLFLTFKLLRLSILLVVYPSGCPPLLFFPSSLPEKVEISRIRASKVNGEVKALASKVSK